MKKLFGLLVLALLVMVLCMMGAASADDCQHEFALRDCTYARQCSICENTFQGNTAHNWGSWSSSTGSSHARRCTNYQCGAVDSEYHSGGTATCTDKAVCTGCGQPYGEVDPNAHDWGEWESRGSDKSVGHIRYCTRDHYHYESKDHTGGNPTCSEPDTCEVCGGAYTYMNNHAYGTTDWGSYDDTKHVKLCEGCKHVVDRAEHSFDNDADPACNDCGYTRTVAGHVHVWSSEWSGNNWFHWHNCTADGCDLPSHLGEGKEGFSGHTLGEGHTHDGDGGVHKGTCTVCGKTDALNRLYTVSWKYDDTHHWNECGCGVKEFEGEHWFDNDADATCNDGCGYTREVAHEHYGGTATCTGKAVCTGCGQPYGEVDSNNHDWKSWELTGIEKQEGHYRHCRRDVNHVEREEHTGGNPTCTVQGECDVCPGLYYDMSNHGDYGTSEWKVYSDTHHYHTCLGCDNNILTVEHDFDSDADPKCDTCGYTRGGAHEHSGGTATCTEQAICVGCGQPYGEVDSDNHDWGEWEYKDVLNVVGHVRYCKWKRYHQEEGKHTGGNPTCTVQDECGVCYGPYYDMSNHGDHGTSEWKVYSDTYHYHTCLGCGNNILTVEHVFDSDIDPKCDTCGYTREVAHEHDWGEWKSDGDSYHTRTCQTDGCNESERKKCRTTHDCFRVYCTECDYETLFDSAHHEWMYADSNGDNTHTFICSRDSSHTEIGSCYGGTATCTKRAMCAGCFSYHGEALGHAPGAEATCTTDQICTREGCGVVLKEKLGHTPGAEATCTTDQVCTREGCGAVLKEKLGHAPGAEATCTTDQVCTREGCGAVLKAKLGHTPGAEATCTTDQVCTREGCGTVLKEKLGHAPGAEATCTTDQLCTREGCGVVLKAKLGHAPGAEATCTTDQVCTREGCGVVLKEKLGHTEVIDPAVAPTCTETGLTEGKHCGACTAVLIAQEVVPANSHSYESETITPTCTKSGYTTHTCAVCGDTYTDSKTSARGHWYDLWHPNGDGTHSAACKRYGCSHEGTTECTLYEVIVKDGDTETILTICPVCGDHERATLDVVSGAALKNVYINQPLPHGEQIVRELDAPFNSVLYAFTVAYELAGRVVPFNGKVSVSLPLDAEKYAGFKLMRVGVTPATETTERAEVWTDVAFTFENGKLTFETDIAGLFLLVPIE